MMTVLEKRFMELVPNQLIRLEKALKSLENKIDALNANLERLNEANSSESEKKP